jgi:hypothetical protein
MARAHRADYLSLLDEVVDLRKGSRRRHDRDDYLASCGSALSAKLNFENMARIIKR